MIKTLDIPKIAGSSGLDFSDAASIDNVRSKKVSAKTRIKAPLAAKPDDVVDDAPRRGRGTVSNRSARFETIERIADDDGWGSLDTLEPFKTSVTIERPKTIITRNESPDLSFDRSINPYRGCEHGCVYCFARPTHAFMGLSSGLDFETRLFVKEGAAERLAAELSVPNYKVRTIAIGTNTDPYQPIERERKVMRSVLEVLSRFNHPVGIVTKSVLVTRDIDVLGPMAEKGAGQGRSIDHHIGRETCPNDGAAGLNASAPPRGDPPVVGSGASPPSS